MKIHFVKDCELEVEEIDKDGEIHSVNELFYKDEIFEGDLIDNGQDYIDFQFGDGSCLYGLKKELFEIIEK